jgi:uncharacterized coiled-coil protein SlyX
MSGGNGVDIAAVYQLLSQVARTVNEHTHRLVNLEHGQATLRQTLTEYHASVMGHGILISQLEDRVRRIEQHLDLSPLA